MVISAIMLSLEPNIVLSEVESARRLRGDHMRVTDELIKAYQGNYYRKSQQRNPRVENQLFATVATFMPRLIWSQPKVSVKCDRSEAHRAMARVFELGINYSLERQDRLFSELFQAGTDMLFNYGILKACLEPLSGWGLDSKTGVMGRWSGEVMKPGIFRVSPEQFFIDAQARNIESARLMGDEEWRDLEDMYNDPRYDQAALRSLSAQVDEQARRRGNDRNAPDRKRCPIYHVWLPEHNLVGCLSPHNGGTWLYEPHPWFGHGCGPYSLFGSFVVPDCPYPLSLIAGAVAELDVAINAHAAAAARGAAREKEIYVGDVDAKVAAAAKLADDGAIVSAPGLRADALQKIEFGGARDSQLGYINYLRETMDRMAGVSDASRGRVRGVTKGEVELVDAHERGRAELIVRQYEMGVERAIEIMSWWVFHSPDVAWQLEGGYATGGITPMMESFEDFGMKIQAYSMGRTDPQVLQQMAQRKFELTAAIAPLMAQFPYINWAALLDELGQATNNPDWAATILMPGAQQMFAGQPILPGAPAPGQTWPGAPAPQTASPAILGGSQGLPVATMPGNVA